MAGETSATSTKADPTCETPGPTIYYPNHNPPSEFVGAFSAWADTWVRSYGTPPSYR